VPLNEDQRKSLELLQAVIARLASNSFLLKGWSVTLASALLGFAGRQEDADLARLTLLPALIFWALDAYYLAQERQYRQLFSQTRDGVLPPFTFEVPRLSLGQWLRALVSMTVVGLHGLIAALALYLSFAWR
jgi:phosphotransferase system  glucose/maltose/N-acetylglucosamine-specific IIC component